MFATPTLSQSSGDFLPRGIAYDPSRIDSSRHGPKQIDLWMSRNQVQSCRSLREAACVDLSTSSRRSRICVKTGAAVGWAETPFAPCPPTEPAAQHIAMVGTPSTAHSRGLLALPTLYKPDGL